MEREKLPLKLKVMGHKPYMIISWNVNVYGIGVHEWLTNYIRVNNPDVIFLSETKRKAADLEPLFATFIDYNVIMNIHEPPQWHGVVMLIRKDHIYEKLPIEMNIATRSDSKSGDAATGRIIAISFNGKFYIIGSYTPNAGQEDIIKLTYRVRTWDPAFMHILEILRANGPTMWLGDINVAPYDIDVSTPPSMNRWAGCSPQERSNFRSLMSTGNWVDVWRKQNPMGKSYTWTGNTRRPNYGMRLDNIIVSKNLTTELAFTVPECPISDHIPIGIYV